MFCTLIIFTWLPIWVTKKGFPTYLLLLYVRSNVHTPLYRVIFLLFNYNFQLLLILFPLTQSLCNSAHKLKVTLLQDNDKYMANKVLLYVWIAI